MSKFIKTQNVCSILRQHNYTRHSEVSLLKKKKNCAYVKRYISNMSFLRVIPKAVYVKRYFKCPILKITPNPVRL